MTKSDPVPIVISIVSLVIALLALLNSWLVRRIQRKSYNLQLQAAQRAHRLQAVEAFYRDKQKQTGLGFRVRNGPDEVTVTRAEISITYTLNDPDAILWDEERYIFDVSSDEFGVLGVTGPEFGFRLAPFDEREWRLPYSASRDLPDIPAEEGASTRRYQQINFVFSVTASGSTTSSRPLLLGRYEGQPMFGYRHNTRNIGRILEKTIIGALAREALQTVRPEILPTLVPPELKEPILSGLDDFKQELEHLAKGGRDVPLGLQKWLVDIWEQAGSFSDEQTERLARTLVKLRPATLGS